MISSGQEGGLISLDFPNWITWTQRSNRAFPTGVCSLLKLTKIGLIYQSNHTPILAEDCLTHRVTIIIALNFVPLQSQKYPQHNRSAMSVECKSIILQPFWFQMKPLGGKLGLCYQAVQCNFVTCFSLKLHLSFQFLKVPLITKKSDRAKNMSMTMPTD